MKPNKFKAGLLLGIILGVLLIKYVLITTLTVGITSTLWILLKKQKHSEN